MATIKYAQYRARAKRLATRNHNEDGEIYPSMTDQSGAEDSDVNVIVKRYGVYGTVPSGKNPPQFGADYSEIPTDLRDMIESARMLEIYRGQLPDALKALNVEDLITMTPQAIADILKPPVKLPVEEGKTT